MAQAAVELIIEGNGRPALVQALRELWAFREVVWAFAERDTRLKYKQAVLGVAWAVIQPLAFLAIFIIVFGRVAGVSGGGVSYPAFALAALVPWFFVQTAVSFGAQALLMDAALVRKVYFPREAPIVGAVLSSGLDFAIGLGLLLILGPLLGTRLSWTLLFAVPLWLILVVLASGTAMTLGALNVYYRDFRYALPLILQLWMFASPVAYPLSAVPGKWKAIYVLANPLTGILDGFQRALAEGRPPELHLVAISAAAACLIAWAGYWVFKRMEPGFAETV
jgi:ABC-type polysaccharide/polyol phosphate export permease